MITRKVSTHLRKRQAMRKVTMSSRSPGRKKYDKKGGKELRKRKNVAKGVFRERKRRLRRRIIPISVSRGSAVKRSIKDVKGEAQRKKARGGGESGNRK